MARANKRSRLRGLPPRIQLTERDAMTGSFPTTARIASDNRTGRYFNPWNDEKVIDIGTYPSSSNTWLDNLALYFKFGKKNLIQDRFYYNYVNNGTRAGELFFSASHANDWFTSQVGNDPSATKIYYGTNAPGFFSGSLEYTGNDGGLSFNAFGPNDFLPNFPEYVNPTTQRQLWTYMNLGNPDTSFALTPLSVAAWVKIDGLGDTKSTIVKVDGDREFEFSVSVDGFLYFTAYTDSSNYFDVYSDVQNFSAVTGNPWRHVCATYASSAQDASDFNLYVDGQWVSSSGTQIGTFTGMTPSGGEICFIGTTGNSSIADEQLGGTLAELAFFNKELSATEVDQIYKCRSSLVLPEQGGVVYPVGLDTQSPWIDNTEFTSSMVIPNAQVVYGVGDTFVHFSPGQDLTAFRDHDLPAVDGKSQNLAFFATGSTVIDAGEGFQQPLWDKSVLEFDYKVVLSTSIGYRSASNGTSEGADYAMMYYDTSTQTFLPVGSARSWEAYQEIYDTLVGFTSDEEASSFAAQAYLAEKAVGFMPFVPNVANSQLATHLAQVPVSDFGFPFDDKYHVTVDSRNRSSSILIPLSDKIDKPFIAEKIVVEFSCSHFSRDYWAQGTGGAHGEAINTFFILNQRKTKGFFSGTLTPNIDLGASVIRSQVPQTWASSTSSLDLVTFNQFAFLAAPTASIDSDTSWLAVQQALSDRDIQYYLCGQGNKWERIRFDFTGSIALSGTINLAYPTQNEQRNLLFDGQPQQGWEVPFSLPGPRGPANLLKSPGYLGGRTGVAQLGNADGRNLLRNTVGIEKVNTLDRITGTTKAFPKIHQPTPYILKPTDNLIFGFNCAYIQSGPYTDAFPFTSSSVNRGPTLSILPGTFRVRIYGSSVVEGEESHDTLNQLLSSNTIHEVIE